MSLGLSQKAHHPLGPNVLEGLAGILHGRSGSQLHRREVLQGFPGCARVTDMQCFVQTSGIRTPWPRCILARPFWGRMRPWPALICGHVHDIRSLLPVCLPSPPAANNEPHLITTDRAEERRRLDTTAAGSNFAHAKNQLFHSLLLLSMALPTSDDNDAYTYADHAEFYNTLYTVDGVDQVIMTQGLLDWAKVLSVRAGKGEEKKAAKALTNI